MSQYSEATQRVFERALQSMKGKIDDSILSELRKLLASGKLGELDEVERIVCSQGAGDAD